MKETPTIYSWKKKCQPNFYTFLELVPVIFTIGVELGKFCIGHVFTEMIYKSEFQKK